MASRYPQILVIRSEPGASETVARLEAADYETIKSPVLAIANDLEVALPDLSEIEDLIFTSANGVRAFSQRSDRRDHKAWCVGPATAAAAEEAGFERVEQSSGNATDLADYIIERTTPTDKRMLHIANAEAKGHLRTRLTDAGFALAFCPLYRMTRASHLPMDALEALVSQAPTLVLIHSEKGALAFSDLISSLTPQNCTGVAISHQAAEPLSGFALKHINIADRPDEDSLMETLQMTVATLST
ncbi:MAG: uroporphyrinogen-III synthase [Pseudomonadota bacterium]